MRGSVLVSRKRCESGHVVGLSAQWYGGLGVGLATSPYIVSGNGFGGVSGSMTSSASYTRDRGEVYLKAYCVMGYSSLTFEPL